MTHELNDIFRLILVHHVKPSNMLLLICTLKTSFRRLVQYV